MASVWISRKAILAEVFKGVGYTFQKYDVYAISGGMFVGSVSFLTGGHGNSDTHGSETCYGPPAATPGKAEESAAFDAIKLISCRLHVDVKDINYAEWFTLQSENSKLERDAKLKDQTIASLTKYVSRLEAGWNCTIEQVEGLLENMSLRIFEDNPDADINHAVDMNGTGSDSGMEDSLKVVITAACEALSRAQEGL